MMRPNVVPRKLSDEQKDETRARILARLIERKSVAGSWREVRAELGMEDTQMSLFKRSCWHLSVGDRDHEGKPRIRVTRTHEGDRKGTGLYGPPPFTITAL